MCGEVHRKDGPKKEQRHGKRTADEPRRVQRTRGSQASSSAASARTAAGRLPDATSASVTDSSTARRLARTAIQTSCRAAAAPTYDVSSGREPWTTASG